MSAIEDVTEVVRRRQRRVARAIVEVKEQIADPHLTPEEAARLRKVIFDEVGDFADLIVSLLPSVTRDDVSLNGHAIELLEQIHSHITAD